MNTHQSASPRNSHACIDKLLWKQNRSGKCFLVDTHGALIHANPSLCHQGSSFQEDICGIWRSCCAVHTILEVAKAHKLSTLTCTDCISCRSLPERGNNMVSYCYHGTRFKLPRLRMPLQVLKCKGRDMKELERTTLILYIHFSNWRRLQFL